MAISKTANKSTKPLKTTAKSTGHPSTTGKKAASLTSVTTAKKSPTPKAPATTGSATRHPGETLHWLMKSEPESYSIDAFKKDKKTLWTGVRNYQARNFMMTAMQKGDRFLFYHSNAEPTGVVGVGRITRVGLPDPSALDKQSDYYDPKASTDHPIWFCAEVEYEGTLAQTVTLAEIRSTKELAQMPLLQKGQRLSIQPVSAAEFATILKMGGGLK